MNERPDFQAESCPQRLALRDDGYLPLERYAAIGDGRSIALCGADGSIDWWCVPEMDSPPLFDRLLSPEEGGFFSLAPDLPFRVQQRYRHDGNVHETLFTTESGQALLVESLNSGSAGRLPWTELARRVDGVAGTMRFRFALRLGTMGNSVSPYLTHSAHGTVLHAGEILGALRHSANVTLVSEEDGLLTGHLTVAPGERGLLGLVIGKNEPLVARGLLPIGNFIN
ncbi:hypothetical protein FHS85_004677 [Rhodoligotrophos appendicifer]|nr:trehalase-like domain-containing protein [Rhodoligotrophos appendicifer]